MSERKNVPFCPLTLPAAGMRTCGAAPIGCTTSATDGADTKTIATNTTRERKTFMTTPAAVQSVGCASYVRRNGRYRSVIVYVSVLWDEIGRASCRERVYISVV